MTLLSKVVIGKAFELILEVLSTDDSVSEKKYWEVADLLRPVKKKILSEPKKG